MVFSVLLFVFFFLQSLAQLSNSKLSIFTSWGSKSQSIVFNGRPRLVKLFDNFSPAKSIKETVPNITIIGRIYLANQPTTNDPVSAAKQWWQQVAGTIMANPEVDYWEGYNEPPCDPSHMSWISAMEAERVKLLASHGRRACIFNFATGNPDVTNPTLIRMMFPAIDAALAHQGILGLHEYSGCWMNSGFSGSVKDGSGWLTGRYRKLYDILRSGGRGKIPLAITENGIDSSPFCQISSGWRTHCSFWASQNHTGGDLRSCAAFYLRQLQWYDSVMRSDDYVIGSTIFALEIPAWQNYDISPMADLLTRYLISQQ